MIKNLKNINLDKSKYDIYICILCILKSVILENIFLLKYILFIYLVES